MTTFMPNIYIFLFFFGFLFSFTSFFHTFPSLTLSSGFPFFLLFPLSAFPFFNIFLLILLCACLLHLFCRFGLCVPFSFINEIKAGASPPDFQREREQESRERPQMVMLCNFQLNMVG
jgi:hypothetical protein